MFHRVADIINRLKLDIEFLSGGNCVDYSPITGEQIASFPLSDAAQVQTAIDRSCRAFREWREVPPHERGETIRLFAEELRENREDLINLIMIETGKIRIAAQKEIDRTIAVSEFVASIPQRLSGVSAPTENHRLSIAQTWVPLGPVAVITSFNFPVRVWAMNALVALACGNSVIWRPSRKATLTAFAVNTLLRRAKARSTANCPEYLSQLLICDHPESAILAQSKQIPLLCATGSPVISNALQSKVGARLGRSILTIGGNNAAVVTESADIDLAVREILLSTIADCGQRSTSLQRLFCHRSVYDAVVGRLKDAFLKVYVNSPFERMSEIGPMIDREGFDIMQSALDRARALGGVVTGGDRLKVVGSDKAYCVQPAVVEFPDQNDLVKAELLAPLLYVMPYDDLEDAIAKINAYPQTLVSCLFTNNVAEAGLFSSMNGVLSTTATINAGTVGYDLQAIFGSGKSVGAGDPAESWRTFMQARTCLINYNV